MNISCKFKNIMLGVLCTTLLLVCPLGSALAGGSPPDPLCVSGDDFGDLLKKRVTVKASAEGTSSSSGAYTLTAPSGWKDTNIDLVAGKRLQIRSYGMVNLCGSSERSLAFKPDPKISSWQSTGIYIKKGVKYKISVTGNYKRWPTTQKSCTAGTFWNSTCTTDKGKSIFAYIGNTELVSNWSSMKPAPMIPTDTGYAKADPQFYELYNYTSGVSGYDFDPTKWDSTKLTPDNIAAQPEGLLYFRYADNPTGNGYDTNWAGNYSDNSGGYTVTVTTMSSCSGNNGEFLVGYIGDADPKKAIPDVTNPDSGGALINLHKYAAGDATTTPRGPVGEYNKYSPATGRLWLKVIDSKTINWEGTPVKGDGVYTPYVSSTSGSNFGEYLVDIITDAPEKDGFTKLINKIIDPIREFVQGNPNATPPTVGLTERMYKGITGNIDFIMGVRAAMTLAVVFFAFSYMVGLSNITQKELFHLIVKMSIIITLIGPTSWTFFNNYLFAFFTDGVNDLIRIMTSQFATILDGAQITTGDKTASLAMAGTGTEVSQASDTFAFLNVTLERFFTKQTNIKIAALLGTFPIGFIMGILMYIGMAMFIFAIIKSLIIYLLAILMLAFLMFLAPIFIPFILFAKTKIIFDKWIKQLINFALQPILLFTVLAIFNVFIFSALHVVLNFSVCWSCVFEMDLPISEFLFNNSWFFGGNFDKFCVIPGYMPWGIDSDVSTSMKLAKTPVGLFMILIFFILCDAMIKFTDWITDVAKTLVGGGPNLSGAASGAMAEAVNTVKTTATTTVATAKFGAHAAGRLGDGVGIAMTGGRETHAFTDATKKTARSAIGAVGGRSRTANVLFGGHSFRGGADGMGGKTRWDRSLMTSTEKKALDRERKAFGKLGGDDADKKIQLQADYIKMKQDQQKDYKGLNKKERKEQRALKRNETNVMGGRRAGFFGGIKGGDVAAEVMKQKTDGIYGYSTDTIKKEGGGKKADEQRRLDFRMQKQEELKNLDGEAIRTGIKEADREKRDAAHDARADAKESRSVWKSASRAWNAFRNNNDDNS